MWSRLRSLLSLPRARRHRGAQSGLQAGEALEIRQLLSADPLPVLMVIADQQDFYYTEYAATRASIESRGLSVQVAATTTNPSRPHDDSGQGSSSGIVTPDVALANADASDYSAIVFVGGWGASMYQYGFNADYVDNRYDGDPATKTAVNNLINDFVDQDKYVTAICHGVTVLAWARVDGVSPLDGKLVSVPYIGSPAVTYNGQFYGYFELGAYEQVVWNGATANTVSGQFGQTDTVNDDVVVDGRIITAENYDSAPEFGRVVADQVLAWYAAMDSDDPPVEDPPALPVNQAPLIAAANFSLAESTAAGMVVGQVLGSDSDAGQSLIYQITGGNTGGAFSIDASTGVISVANAAALDFETNPLFSLEVSVTDDAASPLGATATVAIELTDVFEAPPSPVHWEGNDLYVIGTAGNDTIYLWSGANNEAFVWMNGTTYGSYAVTNGRVFVYAGDGMDQVYATDAWFPVAIFGEGGHDQITGGHADDVLHGGDGHDRIWAGDGNDVVFGGTGDDQLDGREGDDVLVGGDGSDWLAGFTGRDVLIGGLGCDWMAGGDGEDLLMQGNTVYDNHLAALVAIGNEWRRPIAVEERMSHLSTGLDGGIALRANETVFNDCIIDSLFMRVE